MNKRDEIAVAVSQIEDAISSLDARLLTEAVRLFDFTQYMPEEVLSRRAVSEEIHSMLMKNQDLLQDPERIALISGIIPIPPSVANNLLRKTSGIDHLIIEAMMLSNVMHNVHRSISIGDVDDFIIYSSKEVFRTLDIVHQKDPSGKNAIHCLDLLLNNHEFLVSDFCPGDFISLNNAHAVRMAMHNENTSNPFTSFLQQNQSRISDGIRFRENIIRMVGKRYRKSPLYRPEKMYSSTPLLLNLIELSCTEIASTILSVMPIKLNNDDYIKRKHEVDSLFRNHKDDSFSLLKNNLTDDFIRSSENNNKVAFSIAHAIGVYPVAPTDKVGLGLFLAGFNRYCQHLQASEKIEQNPWAIQILENLICDMSDATIQSLKLDRSLPRALTQQSSRYKRCSLASDLGM
jgi:hypothetical protein